MKTITPYLFFPGTCKEAMHFYEQALGGAVTGMMTYKDAPGTPPEMADMIINCMFKAEGIEFMASDNPQMEMGDKVSGTMALCINFADEDSLHATFDKLSVDGTNVHPPKDEFWGARFAAFQDKYGIDWMLNFQKTHIPQ